MAIDFEYYLGAEGSYMQDAYDDLVDRASRFYDSQEADYNDFDEYTGHINSENNNQHNVEKEYADTNIKLGGTNMLTPNLANNMKSAEITSKNIDYQIKVQNVETGEIITNTLDESNPFLSKLKRSSFLEKVEKTNVGDTFEDNNKVYNLLQKGEFVKSMYQNVSNRNNNKLDENKLNYTFFYGYQNEKLTPMALRILNGVKHKVNDKDYSQEDADFFLKKLNTILNENKGKYTMICMNPGHEKCDRNSSTLNTLIEKTYQVRNGSVINGAQALIRKYDVVQQHNLKDNQRNESQNLNNLKASLDVRIDVRGKDIILIDDIVTTGNSLRIAKEKLLEVGAKSVTCYAFAMAHTKWCAEAYNQHE